jgi:nonsense-mediated mRNA decay protein 3
MFCVECGTEGKLYQSLCADCFLKKKRFTEIPNNIDVEICTHCNLRKKGKHWVSDLDKNILQEVVSENVKTGSEVSDFDIHIAPNYEDESNVNVQVIVHAKVDDLKAEEKHQIRVRFKKTVCEECRKQQGGYWEAKVQLRGAKKGLSEEEKERAFDIVDLIVAEREKKDKDAFVTKIEEIHSGLDFYFGSKSMGKAISKKLASDFGGNVKESGELIGKSDGKDIYRMTYAVRLLEFQVGDFLQLDEQVFQVRKISSDGVLLRALESGSDFWFSTNDLEKGKGIGGPEIIQEMVVVSRGKNEMQVLDPDNLKTIDVLVPEGMKTNGESVKVVKYESGYYLVEEV